MKKFVFTLETVAKYKATVEKKQKADLARIIAKLNALYEERDYILEAMANNAASLLLALEEQRDLVQELKRHDNYQRRLREWQADVRQQIATAEVEKKRLQALLIVTMKEIRTLERIRADEYQVYLAEVRKEENLVIGDIIAYKSSAAGAQ